VDPSGLGSAADDVIDAFAAKSTEAVVSIGQSQDWATSGRAQLGRKVLQRYAIATKDASQGNRGGDDHNADLLKELQAIALLLLSVDRFGSNGGNEGSEVAGPQQTQHVNGGRSEDWKQRSSNQP